MGTCVQDLEGSWRMTDKADSRRKASWPEEILKKYQPAIKSLRRNLKSLPEEVVSELEYRLIEECEHATRAVDRFGARRRADIASVQKSAGFVKAAKALANFMQQFPDQAAAIVGDALFALRREGLRFRIDSGALALPANAEDLPEFIPDKKPVRVEQAIGRLAVRLGRSVVEHNPARRGPWAHRTSIPGARFDKPLDEGRHKKLVDPATVLGFHLVFWLRAFTTEAETGTGPRPGDGVPMPKTGDPHFKVAEEFILCAFGDQLMESFDLADRLRKLPKMQYLSW
jgi:hypothetical protein